MAHSRSWFQGLLALYWKCAAVGALLLLAAAPAGAQIGGEMLPETLPWPAYTQDAPNFESEPLPYIEQFLAPIADHVLNHDSIAYKLKLNKYLANALAVVLKRGDSYNYNFPNLTTLSRVRPQDNSFRIFTWYMQDPNGNHRYYGFVQRRSKNAPSGVKLTSLLDVVDYSPRIESTLLEPQNWFGALYYKPRYSDYGVLTYEGQWQRVDGFTGKRYTEDVKYYVVLGWNGHSRGNDYKLIDVVTFNEEDELIFGAPIFYTTTVPKSRVVFKYSDNSPFSLNQAMVVDRSGLFKRKRKMIVFDHLVEPSKTRQHKFWNLGLEGTVDAYVFLNRVSHQRKGIFGFLRDVDVYEPSIEDYDPKAVEKQREEAMKRLREAGIELNGKRKGREAKSD